MLPLKLNVGPSRLALLFLIAIAPCILAGIAYLTAEVDAAVKIDEQKLVQYALANWYREAEAKTVGQADWDDAMLNLGKHYDPSFAHAVVGDYLYTVGGLEQAFVVDGRGTTLYASLRGVDRPTTAYAPIGAVTGPLFEQLRVLEHALHQQADFGKVLAKPIHRSSLKNIGGTLYLVTLTLVQSDYGHVVLDGPAPVLVTLAAMDDAFARRFPDQVILEDLSIAVGARFPAQRERAVVDLRDSDGGLVGAITWNPHRPGHRLFDILLLPILLLLSALLLAAAALEARERLAAQALVASERGAHQLALHDSLTGLPNRVKFNHHIARAVEELRSDGAVYGLLAIDLDGFKQVNDSYGHATGDELIVAVALRLATLVEPGELIARLGGDEFALVCRGATVERLAAKARDAMALLAEPNNLGVGQLFTAASIGGALIDDASADGGEALRRADVALYRAKAAGRGQYRLFTAEMDADRVARRDLELDLRAAIGTRALSLAYQPQVDFAGRVCGLEALLRWNHPERGAISPAHFIPIAEECGLINAVGDFVIEQAFADAHRWPGIRIAINVSAIQFQTPGFSDRVRAHLARSNADARQFEIEITEHILLNQDDHTIRALRELRSLGFTIALDDFGTGYSSLSYLRCYPVDTIKIDRSFITSLGVDTQSDKLIGAIAGLAAALGIKLIAEGVETVIQWDALKRAGCRHFQGFLFHRPQPSDDIVRLLEHSAVRERSTVRGDALLS